MVKRYQKSFRYPNNVEIADNVKKIKKLSKRGLQKKEVLI